MKVEVAVLDSPPHLIITSSPDGLCGRKATLNVRGPELIEELCGPRLTVADSPYGLCGRKATSNVRGPELRSCVKVEVAVLDSPSLIVLMVSNVDVKQH